MNDLSEITELTLKLLDDAIDEQGRERLEKLIEEDEAARECFMRLVEQEAGLRGLRKDVDLADRTIERIRTLQEERIQTGVLDQIKKRSEAPSPAEPAVAWLWGKQFWKWSAAVAALLFLTAGGSTVWMSLREATPQEAFLFGRNTVTPGAVAPQRVFVRDAKTGRPLANADVRLTLFDPDGEMVVKSDARSDEHGMVLFEPELAADAKEGDYTLEVNANSGKGSSSIKQKLAVKRSFKVMVSTDKPLYQPGQLIHIRTLSLATADMRPMADRDVVIEVRDAKANKVFKKKMKTSAFGIAAADFQLADQVNTGSYTISATVGDTTSERNVTVKRYQLPKYRVDLVTERGYYAPGKRVKGHIRAGYTFGEPVSGAQVKVRALEFIHGWEVFATIEGKTGADGVFRFEVPLKDYFAGADVRKGDATVSIAAEVIDTAGHRQVKNRELTVTTEPIRVEFFPESGKLVQNVENVLYVLTTYPDGRPARTTVHLGKTRQRLETSSAGIAKVKITPTKSELQLTAEVEDTKGARVMVSRKLRIEERSDLFLLRTDRAVYKAGDTADIRIHAASGGGVVFVDAVKDRRTVLTRSLTLKDGQAQLALDMPPDLFGTIELHAYRILPHGEIIGDTRIVQVDRADDLSITAELDKESYKPAEKALLRLAVKRHDGTPVQAALGLAGVDEAVFALSEMRPGLERVYFALQEELLKPRYEIHAHVPLNVRELSEPQRQPTPELEEATVVLFSQAEGQTPPNQGASETFAAREQQFREAERVHNNRMVGVAAVSPVILFVLLVLPLVAYALWRLWRRTPVDAEPAETAAFGRCVRWTAIWWAAIFYLPIAGAIFASALFFRYREEGALITAVLLALLALICFSFRVHHFRSLRLAKSLPLLRKLVSALPFAAVLGIGGFIAVLAAKESWPRYVSDSVFGMSLLAIVTAIALIPGALSAGVSSALRSVTVVGWLGLFASRTALAATPALIPFVLVLALGSSHKASELAGGVMRDTVWEATANKAEPECMPFPTDEGGAEGLKAPTRVRRHFPETLLWIPELITSEQGEAQVSIPLADSITTWRIGMSAVSGAGALGAKTLPLRVFQDFFVDIDFPVALTQHDRVTVPVAVYNYLDRAQTVRLDVEARPWFRLSGPASQSLQVGPKQVTSVSFTLEALKPGTHAFTVRAHGSAMADAVERTVRVEPDGKAVVQTLSGRLDENKRHEIVIPDHAIPGADDLFVKIYPGSFSQVVEGLDSMLRMPSGCFEQTSSATYPNVLVLDYLRRTKQIKPEIEMKALQYINTGYQRLLSYEVAGGGFEWFGKAPAHTVLTAYGLMEFTDMAKVYDVDPDVITRTREWLFSKQDGDGSWKPPVGGIAEGAINQHRGKKLRTTCYIAWAMTESAAEGRIEEKLRRALDYVASNVQSENDPYSLAVCANALVAGEHPDARKVLERLDALKQVEGKHVYWTSQGEGATFSRGNVLDIETTAIAAYAFLKAKHGIDVAHKALAWLVGKKDQFGNWSSTQATVHSFRALLMGGEGDGGVTDKMSTTVAVNGKVARELTITPENADVFHLISVKNLIKRGKNLVVLETAGKGNLAYQVVATHYVPWAGERRPEAKPMTIDVAYDTTTLERNDQLKCSVTVTYHRPGTAAMSIVDLGIPPGFQVMPGTFEALKDRGIIERFSVTGRQVILYIREIQSAKPLTFDYRLRAKFPVKAKAPAATVYQYYEPEVRDTTKPVELTVM